MKFIYTTTLQVRILLVTFLLVGTSVVGQSVDPPVLSHTDNRGVKFYTSKGFENNSVQSTPFVQAVQPTEKLIGDFTLEEISNILIDLEFKLAQYQMENDSESIDIILAYQILLIEQKTILSNQN